MIFSGICPWAECGRKRGCWTRTSAGLFSRILSTLASCALYPICTKRLCTQRAVAGRGKWAVKTQGFPPLILHRSTLGVSFVTLSVIEITKLLISYQFFFFLVGWWISTLSTWKYYLGSFGKHWFLVTHFLSQKQWVWDKTRASGEFKYLLPPQEIPMHNQEPPALSKGWV